MADHTRINFNLPTELVERLRAYAEADDRSMTYHLTKALAAYLKEKQA